LGGGGPPEPKTVGSFAAPTGVVSDGGVWVAKRGLTFFLAGPPHSLFARGCGVGPCVGIRGGGITLDVRGGGGGRRGAPVGVGGTPARNHVSRGTHGGANPPNPTPGRKGGTGGKKRGAVLGPHAPHPPPPPGGGPTKIGGGGGGREGGGPDGTRRGGGAGGRTGGSGAPKNKAATRHSQTVGDGGGGHKFF